MKKLFLLLPLSVNISFCADDIPFDNGEYYCWECECEQNGEFWWEEYHMETEDFIRQLEYDDLQEFPPIYTKCYIFDCRDHSFPYYYD